MGIKNLFGVQKTAAQQLEAVQARIADLEAQERKLAEEKAGLEADLNERIKNDAIGQAELTDQAHRKALEGIQDAEVRRDRVARTVQALRDQLPGLERAAGEERAAAALAKVKPLNDEIGKVYQELRRAIRKVGELCDKLPPLYDQLPAIQQDYLDAKRQLGEASPQLPFEGIVYPVRASLEVWLREVRHHLLDPQTEWMNYSLAAELEHVQGGETVNAEGGEEYDREYSQFLSEWNSSLTPRATLGLSENRYGPVCGEDFKEWREKRGATPAASAGQ